MPSCYRLTLTKSERKAIDWIGYRYSHGNELYYALIEGEFDNDWDFDGDVTFDIPEHVAWNIKEIIEEDNLECLSSEFTEKLLRFTESIV